MIVFDSKMSRPSFSPKPDLIRYDESTVLSKAGTLCTISRCDGIMKKSRWGCHYFEAPTLIFKGVTRNNGKVRHILANFNTCFMGIASGSSFVGHMEALTLT